MSIKVCSFNIRYDTQEDGINAFDSRKSLILDRFVACGADLVGFQEVLPHVRVWLEENLKMYSFAGCGRHKDLTGENALIGYRTDKFILVHLDTFWLSDTPHVPGSRFTTDQSNHPRICTSVVLQERDSGKLVRMYNTHLDHLGEMAKVQGMTQILTKINQDDSRWPDVPVILTGDLNATPDSAVYGQIKGFVSNGSVLKDLSETVGGTFHGYRPQSVLEKIDYIFTNCPADVSQSCCLKDEENGVYLSDHYPVVAHIEL